MKDPKNAYTLPSWGYSSEVRDGCQPEGKSKPTEDMDQEIKKRKRLARRGGKESLRDNSLSKAL